MLKRMELWDFESHEHTVVEDLSPGLNFVCGESNSGKTSLVRALKLVAYNEFDPRSIRVGATKCQVLVETDRGTVKVTRGPKNNLWEVTRKGEKTQHFDKVGKGVVLQAAEVIGLNVVTLGDVEVPVNIMDQMESHFMLSGVGGKDASGSMRAQIVDEISGLSGIEGLIKAVSLDNHRFGREVKETEDKMEETSKQLHDAAALDAEQSVLDEAGRLLDSADEARQVSAAGQEALDGWNSSVDEHDRLTAAQDAIPDVDEAARMLSAAGEMSGAAGRADSLSVEANASSDRERELSEALEGIPDLDSARNLLEGADAKTETALSGKELLGYFKRSSESEGRLTEASASMPDEESAAALLKDVEDALEVAEAAGALEDEAGMAREAMEALEEDGAVLEGLDGANGFLEDAGRLCGLLERAVAAKKDGDKARWGEFALKTELSDCESKLKEAEAERDAVLASVTTCPLTMRPVSKECLS